MIQPKDINIWNIATLCSLPLIYQLCEDFPKIQGIIIGLVFMKKVSDIQKYGFEAVFLLPNTAKVENAFILVSEGKLDELKKVAKRIQLVNFVKMKNHQDGYNLLIHAVDKE